MINEVIRVDESSDLDLLIEKLAGRLARRRVDTQLTTAIISDSREVLSALSEQGRTLLSVGSSMQATRTITGDGYMVKLEARFGAKEGLLSKILRNLLGRGSG